LKTMLETDLAWSSTDFGFFTGGFCFLNVFFPLNRSQGCD